MYSIRLVSVCSSLPCINTGVRIELTIFFILSFFCNVLTVEADFFSNPPTFFYFYFPFRNEGHILESNVEYQMRHQSCSCYPLDTCFRSAATLLREVKNWSTSLLGAVPVRGVTECADSLVAPLSPCAHHLIVIVRNIFIPAVCQSLPRSPPLLIVLNRNHSIYVARIVTHGRKGL